MSDIAIRLDGIVLLAALVFGAIAYAIVAATALLTAVARGYPRAAKIARLGGLMAIGTGAGAAGFFVYWDGPGAAYVGDDWVDWLTCPWAAVFLAGCWVLARVR